MQLYRLPAGILAQSTYGGGSYGSESYQEGSSTDNTLSNTGTPLIVGATVGVSLIICSVVILTQIRKKRKK